MAPKPKSIFRQPGAQHFQLVHRSQRDPLSQDPEASSHVLKQIAKGKSRTDLEQVISPEDLAHDLERANIGEAALHGIYFDDTNYDYMQHLREVGQYEEGVEAIFVEAPKSLTKGKGKAKEPIELRSLPDDVLPSKTELSQEDVLESRNAIPSELEGLQPNMDPHLRQTIEALDDDAFVDEALEDDFFAELVGDGELSEGEEGPGFEFSEYGVSESQQQELEEGDAKHSDQSEAWEARFARFKKEHEAKVKAEHDEDDIASDVYSEGGDTIGNLPNITVIGGKKRRKGNSDASGYSMSSSSMFRNEGLSLLDERFDEVEKTYDSDDEEEQSDGEDDEAPELITSREDFDAIMDDFLDNYEVFGGKMHPVLPGDSNADKLGTIRKSFREIGYDPYSHLQEDEDECSEDTLEDMVREKKDRWDCETILSTYSNLENHPRLIRARETTKVTKIKLDPKTGAPSLRKSDDPILNSDVSEEEQARPLRATVTRSKVESKEEKRARKHTVKEERQARRATKKLNQGTFASERKQILQDVKNAKKGVRTL